MFNQDSNIRKMSPSWTHLIRFIAEEDGLVHIGQIDSETFPDIGLATLRGDKISAKLINGTIFDGVVTDKIFHVAKVFFGQQT